MAAKVTKTACKRKGGRYVKFKGRSAFCAMPKGKKRKGSRKGKGKGIAKMSTAERKKMMRATCKKVSGAKRKKMAGLCKWASK